MTTAELRNKAWEAKEAGNYLEAADLFGKAIAVYPMTYRTSDLQRADIANLAQRQAEMVSMAGVN